MISAESTEETVSLLRKSESVRRSNSLDRGGVDVAVSSDCMLGSDARRAVGAAKEILHDDFIVCKRLGGIVGKGALKQTVTSQWFAVNSLTERIVGGKIQWAAFVVRMGLCFSGNSAVRAVVKSWIDDVREKR